MRTGNPSDTPYGLSLWFSKHLCSFLAADLLCSFSFNVKEDPVTGPKLIASLKAMLN